MRITFLGTGAFAVPCLDALVVGGHDVVAVVCQPDRARGRGLGVALSPVKIAATAAGIPVFQPGRIKDPEVDGLLREIRPDVQVVVAYGQILPRRVIDIAPLGTVNVHGSLLPRWRGAAPIQWAIAAGDTKTGVTTMLIDEGLDTGPILESVETPIEADERAPALEARLAALGAELLRQTLAGLETQTLVPKPQDPALATHARPLEKNDGAIDWSLPAQRILWRIRGFDPWPGAFTTFAGRLLKVLSARELPVGDGPAGTVSEVQREGIAVFCGEGSRLLVETVQPESRRPMPAHSFALGARISPGASLVR